MHVPPMLSTQEPSIYKESNNLMPKTFDFDAYMVHG